MGGRFVLGFGVAITSTAGPAYASEMAHPAYRGVLTGIFNTFWFVGGIPGTFVPFGTSGIDGTMSWRIPIWLQMVFAGVVLFCSPFLPETPRWLIANDRHEEALNTMAKYHGEGSRDSPIVQLEYKEMCEDISVTGSDKRWWDYRELFNSREQRYRTMLVFAMGFFGQWSGNGPVSYYYPTMLQGAGITSNHTRLLLNGMQNVVSFAGAIFGAFYTDKWGRRPQLLVSTGCVVFIFVIVCALVATNLVNGPDGKPRVDESGTPLIKSSGQAKAVIAFIFIFGFIISAGYTPLQQLYPVECLRYESRAKGMAFYNFWVNIAGFYNTFVTGIAFSGAGWKVSERNPFSTVRTLMLIDVTVLFPLHLLGHFRIRVHLLLLRRDPSPHARRAIRDLQVAQARQSIAQQDTDRAARPGGCYRGARQRDSRLSMRRVGQRFYLLQKRRKCGYPHFVCIVC